MRVSPPWRAEVPVRLGSLPGRAVILVGAALLPFVAAASGVSPPEPPVVRARAADSTGSVVEAAERMKAGDFIWAPEIAPTGPLLMIVSRATQRATLYRNGVPIAITTVSTGKRGHETPTGVFTILERQVEHYSSLYDSAPMPYMQRLTWGGVALHGGSLPGYPASHGCIRLPQAFARLLYGVTRLGMTVIVTDVAAVPRAAPTDPLLQAESSPAEGETMWNPDRAPSGPVSIIISAADHRMLILRNGMAIGSAPARIEAPMDGTSAFIMRSSETDAPTWIEIAIPGAIAAASPTHFAGRVHVADETRALVAPLLVPGTSVILTPDSLHAGGGARAEILRGEAEDPKR